MCSSGVTRQLPWCRGSGEARTRAGDGFARRGAASHPQEGSRQDRRGGEEESSHGVQVGIPHPVLFSNGDRG